MVVVNTVAKHCANVPTRVVILGVSWIDGELCCGCCGGGSSSSGGSKNNIEGCIVLFVFLALLE